MKKMTIFLTTVVLSFLLVTSCNNRSKINDCFKTKEDSLKFVRAVIQKYPEAQGPKIAEFGEGQAKLMKTFNPIDWEQVVAYSRNYDTFPLIAKTKGFFINKNGLDMLKNNYNYKQIYLRLGKYTYSGTTNDYTIMIIPLSDSSTVLHKLPGDGRLGYNSNYDFLDPCPTVCPEDYDKYKK